MLAVAVVAADRAMIASVVADTSAADCVKRRGTD